MTTPRDTDRVFASWMSEGPDVLRDDVLKTVATEIERTPQRRGLARRWDRLPGLLRAAGLAGAAALVVVVVVAAGIGVLGSLGGGPAVGGPGPTPSPTPSPTPEPSASGSVTSWTIASTVYPYAWTFPADVVTLAPRLARSPWDGKSPCIAQDPCTDWMQLTGTPKPIDRTIWVFGTPTDLALDEFATDVQRQVAEWRPCPAEPPTTRDVVLDGEPARLHAFVCTSGASEDLQLRVFAVHDGIGLVIGMAKLNAGQNLPEAGEIELLLQRLEDFRWMP